MPNSYTSPRVHSPEAEAAGDRGESIEGQLRVRIDGAALRMTGGCLQLLDTFPE